MDPMVMDLLKGPLDETPKQRVVWLKKIHFACASASDNSMSLIAEPLAEAIALLEKLDGPKATEEEKSSAEVQLAGYMLQAQGLAIYCYLEELNKMRNTIAAEVSKQKAGSVERKKGEQLQIAYEMAIDALARAYNGLRAGRLEELKAIVPMMDQVKKAAEEAAR